MLQFSGKRKEKSALVRKENQIEYNLGFTLKGLNINSSG